MASFTSVRNGNPAPFTMPSPYGGVLGPGDGTVIPDTLANVLANFASAQRTGIQFTELPSNYSGPVGAAAILAPVARERVGVFTRENIAAALTDSPIKTQTDGGATYNSQLPERAGSIVGIWFLLSGAAAGDTITIQASIAGVAATASAITIAIAGTQGVATFNRGVIPFTAGQALGMMITTPAGWTAVTVDGIGGLIIEA